MRGVKGKKRRRKAEPDDAAQSARFVEAAKQLGVDESGEAFDKALSAVLKSKRKPKDDGGRS